MTAIELAYGGVVFAIVGTVLNMAIWGMWKDKVAEEMKGMESGMDQKKAMMWNFVYLVLFGAVFTWLLQLSWAVLPGVGYIKGVWLGGTLWVLYLFQGLIMKLYAKMGQTTWMADQLSWLLKYVIGAIALSYLLY